MIFNLHKMKNYLAVFIFILAALLVDFSAHKWKKNEVFNYDVYGYHNYLPAIFIYHDITEYKFLDSIEVKYRPTGDKFYKYGLTEAPKTHYLCNQYPIGVALFQLPFFAVAHTWATLTHQDPPDGYSSPYQHATVLSTLLFATLALLLLISFLRNYFSTGVVFFTVLLLAMGTNFFQYATLESGFSHVYLFFLYTAILYLTRKWYLNATVSHSILLGICIGLCAITRPIDILAFLIPLCWVNSDIPKRAYLKANRNKILLIILFTFIITLPQLIYWKYVTDQWMYYSYTKVDYFQFDRFRLIHGLFSYRKGWFIYTPIALLAFISVLHISRQSNFYFYKKVFWVFFLPMLFLVFSWHNWFYGWSFGCRALIQTLPVLAIPIALLLEKSLTFTILQKMGLYITISFFVFLNLFQTWQYNKGILHGSMMNESMYWRIFLTTKHNPELDKNYKLQEELDWNTGGW